MYFLLQVDYVEVELHTPDFPLEPCGEDDSVGGRNILHFTFDAGLTLKRKFISNDGEANYCKYRHRA